MMKTLSKKILTDLRQYNKSPQQAKWLQSFQWPNLAFSHGDELPQRMNERELFVFRSHEIAGSQPGKSGRKH
jgi:hypothetical protein